MSEEESLAVPRRLLEDILKQMVADREQIHSEWGIGEEVNWDEEILICQVGQLLGLPPDERPWWSLVVLP